MLLRFPFWNPTRTASLSWLGLEVRGGSSVGRDVYGKSAHLKMGVEIAHQTLQMAFLGNLQKHPPRKVCILELHTDNATPALPNVRKSRHIQVQRR